MTALPPDPLDMSGPPDDDPIAPLPPPNPSLIGYLSDPPQVSLGVRLWLAGAILVALGIVVLVVTLRGAS